MHAVVVGCGRVGATIAKRLTAAGNDVVVVDRRPDAFTRLGPDFAGRTVYHCHILDHEDLGMMGTLEAR